MRLKILRRSYVIHVGANVLMIFCFFGGRLVLSAWPAAAKFFVGCMWLASNMLRRTGLYLAVSGTYFQERREICAL